MAPLHFLSFPSKKQPQGPLWRNRGTGLRNDYHMNNNRIPKSTSSAVEVEVTSKQIAESSSSYNNLSMTKPEQLDDMRYYCSTLLNYADEELYNRRNYNVAEDLYLQILHYLRQQQLDGDTIVLAMKEQEHCKNHHMIIQDKTKKKEEEKYYYDQYNLVRQIDYDVMYDIAYTLQSLGITYCILQKYATSKRYLQEAVHTKRYYYQEIPYFQHLISEFKQYDNEPAIAKDRTSLAVSEEHTPKCCLPYIKSSCHDLHGMSVMAETGCNNDSDEDQSCSAPPSSDDGHETSILATNKSDDYLRHSTNINNKVHYSCDESNSISSYYHHTGPATYVSNVTTSSNMDLAYTIEALAHVCYLLHDYTAASKYYTEVLDLKRLWYAKHQYYITNKSKTNESFISSCPIFLSDDKSTSRPDNDSDGNIISLKQQKYGYDKIRSNNIDIAYTESRLGDVAHQQRKYHSARKRYTKALYMYQQYDNNNNNMSQHDCTINVAIIHLFLQLCHVNITLRQIKHAKHYFSELTRYIEKHQASLRSHTYSWYHEYLINHQLLMLYQLHNNVDHHHNFVASSSSSSSSSSSHESNNILEEQMHELSNLLCS